MVWPKATDMEVCTEAVKFWEKDQGTTNRHNWQSDLDFASGHHWPDHLKAMREGDPESPRPCLVIDRLHVHGKNISNRIRRESPSIAVYPVDNNGDQETADVFRGVIRHIENMSMAPHQYAMCGDTQTNAGVGYLRAYVAGMPSEITIEAVDDIFGVVIDPMCKNMFGLDASRGLVLTKVDRDYVTAKYPDKQISEWSADSSGDWMDDDSLYVAEYFRIQANESDKEAKPQVWWYLLTSGGVLEKKNLRFPNVPIIRVPGEYVRTATEKTYRGIIYRGRDSQLMYDYAKSSEAELIALAPKTPYIAAEGQLDGYEADWARMNVSNRPFVLYKSMDAAGNVVGAPQRAVPPQASSAILQCAQGAAEDIRGTTGQHAPSLGYSVPGQSGVALQTLTQEGDTATFHYQHNMLGAIGALGRVLIGMIPMVYGNREVVRIIGEDESDQKFARLNSDMSEPSAEIRINGKIERIYNLGVGQYDVITGAGRSFMTKRQEAADFMDKVTRSAPQLWNIIGDQLIKLSDAEGSREMAERLKRTIPPEILYSEDERRQMEEEKAQQQGGQEQQAQQLQAMMAQAQQQLQQMEMQAQFLDEKLGRAKAEVALKEAQIQVQEGKYANEQVDRMMDTQKMIAAEIVGAARAAPVIVKVPIEAPSRKSVLIRALPGGNYVGELVEEPKGNGEGQ